MSTSETSAGGAAAAPADDVSSGADGRWTFLIYVVLGVLWVGILGLLTLAVLRVVWHDGTLTLTVLNAFTLYVYLPAYVVLALALWTRRWALAAVAAVVIGFHLAWVAPDFLPASALATPVKDAAPSRLRIYFANVLYFNREITDIVAEVEREDPDVVVFVEFSHWLQRNLPGTPFADAYRYGTDISQYYPGEVVVLSRIPIEASQPLWVAGRPCVAVDLPLDGRLVRLFGLHSPRPMMLPAHDYVGFWSEALDIISKQPRPLVVVGDFNATQHSAVYKSLVGMGLRSAFADRGLGYSVSWPNGVFHAPPIRIDHAFVSPDLECLEVRNGVGVGSDHKPFVLDVRLRPGEVAEPPNKP